MSFKPDVRAKEEEVQKASPRIPNMRCEENKARNSENIEMIPLRATSDSRGRVAHACTAVFVDGLSLHI